MNDNINLTYARWMCGCELKRFLRSDFIWVGKIIFEREYDANGMRGGIMEHTCGLLGIIWLSEPDRNTRTFTPAS